MRNPIKARQGGVLTATVCLIGGLALMVTGAIIGEGRLLGPGFSLALVGFSALAIDRVVIEPLVKLLESVHSVLIGGTAFGFGLVFQSRSDPRLLSSCKGLLDKLKDSGSKHEVCISGVAALSLLDLRGDQGLARQFRDILLLDRSALLDVKICLLYPYSHAARNRAIAEANWNRPFAVHEPNTPRLINSPPNYQRDIGSYCNSGLYADSEYVLDCLHRLRDQIADKKNVRLTIRYCTLEPHCMILRVDDDLVVEHYQYGRVSLDNRYVSGHLPVVLYHKVAAPGIPCPPFWIYKNHFQYLWRCESTLSWEQIASTDERLRFITPDRLVAPTSPSDHPRQKLGAIRLNCFSIPSRRVFDRIGPEELKKCAVSADRQAGGSICLHDLGVGGMRVVLEAGQEPVHPNDAITVHFANANVNENVLVIRTDRIEGSPNHYRIVFSEPMRSAAVRALQDIRANYRN